MLEYGKVNFDTIKLNINLPPTPRLNRRRSRILSGRMRNSDPTIRGRMFHIHHRMMGYMCEDCMYRAVTPRHPGA